MNRLITRLILGFVGTSLLVVLVPLLQSGSGAPLVAFLTRESSLVFYASFLTIFLGFVLPAFMARDTAARPVAAWGAVAAYVLLFAAIPLVFTAYISGVSIDGLILFYELTLAAPTTSVSLIITISTTIPIERFTALFRLGDGVGNWGDAFEVQMLALSIPSGEVQVSVSWDALTDVDLHVIDPSGERIYFGNKTSASGGSLDLDANAACSINDPVVNNESIHWPDGVAPAGSYDVEVDYWSSCGGLAADIQHLRSS